MHCDAIWCQIRHSRNECHFEEISDKMTLRETHFVTIYGLKEMSDKMKKSVTNYWTGVNRMFSSISAPGA